MRTTVRLDDAFYRVVLAFCRTQGLTFTRVLEEALRRYVLPEKKIKSRKPVHLKTVKGRGLMPGVNLDNAAELLDFMERP